MSLIKFFVFVSVVVAGRNGAQNKNAQLRKKMIKSKNNRRRRANPGPRKGGRNPKKQQAKEPNDADEKIAPKEKAPNGAKEEIGATDAPEEEEINAENAPDAGETDPIADEAIDAKGNATNADLKACNEACNDSSEKNCLEDCVSSLVDCFADDAQKQCAKDKLLKCSGETEIAEGGAVDGADEAEDEPKEDIRGEDKNQQDINEAPKRPDAEATDEASKQSDEIQKVNGEKGKNVTVNVNGKKVRVEVSKRRRRQASSGSKCFEDALAQCPVNRRKRQTGEGADEEAECKAKAIEAGFGNDSRKKRTQSQAGMSPMASAFSVLLGGL